jgi:hypothetical protein
LGFLDRDYLVHHKEAVVMKHPLCSAAALVAAGWFLLLPLGKHDESLVKASLSTWQVLGKNGGGSPFNSLADCQAARAKLAAICPRIAVEIAAPSRCVETDD